MTLDSQQRLSSDPLMPLVLRLGIPTAIAQAVMVLYSIVDKMFIGHIADTGSLALAGVGIASPITTFISSFAVLVGLGGAPLMAMKSGHGEKSEAERILGTAFSLLLLLSLVLTPLSYFLKDNLLWWFGASRESFPYASLYLGVYLLGTPFALLSTGLNSYLISQGRAKAAMISTVSGAGLNLILDPLFIFTFHLGCAGAAIATVISQGLSTLFVIIALHSRYTPLKLTIAKPNMATTKKIFLFGLSPFIIISTDSILLILLNTVLQRYSNAGEGDILITAATIIQSWHLLLMNPLGGLTGGNQGMISYNYGCGNTDRVRKGIQCVEAISCIYTVIIFILTHTIGIHFIAFFTEDVVIQSITLKYLYVFTAMIIPLSFQYANVDCFTALGQVRYSLPLSLTRKTIFLVVLLVFPPFFGATSAFFAEPVCDLISSILSSTIMWRKLPKILQQREKSGLTI